ncbi:hypothetical protein Y1Q_0004137 [Alligator mississippiensis]|uniref:Uncharacterized protein n=1 Tax=Alligator mississippiensis TaxID=8496 RepID=A0A151PI98_ALLMI|nr:hypothetical protein Y1Q_0004137 [Alligator mississippiensis]
MYMLIGNLPRRVESRCPPNAEVSKKRRKSCKTRKSSGGREYEHLPPGWKFKKNAKCLKNKADGYLVEANLWELPDMVRFKEKRKSHFCPRRNTDVREDKEHDDTSDSEKEQVKEKSCPPPAFTHQQDEVLTVVTFDELDASSTGKVTLRGKAASVESFSSANGIITTEVTCGSFNVKVEIKKLSLFHTGTNLVIEKKKYPKTSKCYHDRRYQKSHHSKSHRHQSPSSDHSVDNSCKHTKLSKQKMQIASNKKPLLKVNIEGKDIKVKYTKRKQNLMINIEPDCESYFSFHEKEEAFKSYPCPDWYVLLPPPKEFADCEDMHSDSITEIVSLFPVTDRKEPDAFSAALTVWEEGNHVCKQTATGIKDNTNEIFPKDRIILSELSYNRDCPQDNDASIETDFGKELINKNSETGQVMYNSFIVGQNTILSSYLEPKATRRKSFPDITIDGFSPGHHRRDSGFYSLPSLSWKVLPKQAKAIDVYSKNTLPQTSYTELSKCSSFASSFNSLGGLKSSYQYSFTSYDHDMTIYPSEPEGSVNNTCLLNHFEDYMEDCKEIQDTFVETIHSIGGLGEKQLHQYLEPLRNLVVCEEHTEFTESGLDEETLESNHHIDAQEHKELESKALMIQIPLPSRSPSSGHISDKSIANKIATDCVQNQLSTLQLGPNVQLTTPEPEVTIRKRKASVVTVITGELEQRLIIQSDNKVIPESFGFETKKEPKLPCSIQENSFMSPLLLDVQASAIPNEVHSFSEVQVSPRTAPDETNFYDDCTQAATMSTSPAYLKDNQVFTEDAFVEETKENLCDEQEIKSQLSDSLRQELVACQIQQLAKSSSDDTENKSETKVDCCQHSDTPMSPKTEISKTDFKLEGNTSIQIPLRDARTSDSSQEEGIDQWARRRKMFKDSKKCGSTGGSSINSTITEGSGNSEDARSVDLSLRSDNEERGFYTENFHSAAWVFRGDDVSPDNSPRCLSKRNRPVAIRERIVKIAKGTGHYPWGFRIQFSKPILVTEVDTNSAAEEAGLQVGDILIAVNGTDVTSMPHSEAANLARKGPDILTLLVGSDISRYPNTPRPTCRGYLHKRTQSAILKGWRKRWFVLKHNGYLHYYKHKKDEGKCRPLEVTKLEGAEIGMDTSLGKPFVFKCIPQNGNRIFHFCATSNQEMKRWLEAMDKAVHPIQQNHVWVDVTLHNTSLPPLAIKNPECLGLLHQLDKTKDVWVQHYCILKDGCLYFYASIRSIHAIGGIYLQGYTVSEQSLGSRRSVIEMKPPSEEFKTFHLCAENVNENKRWVTALKASINKWLPLHQAIQDFMNRPLEETRM